MTQPLPERQGSVLFVIPWSIENTSGGVNVVVSNLYTNFLNNKDLTPIICCLDWGQNKITRVKNNNYTVIKFGMIYPVKGILSFIPFFSKLPLRLYRLYQYIQQQHIKVINFHYPSRSALCVAILKKIKFYNGKLILSFHGTDVHSIQESGFLDNFIYHATDNIIICSAALSHTLKSKIPKKFHEKISIVHNAIHQDNFINRQKTNPEILEELVNRKYILSVAKFDPNKGLDPLIRAFHGLAREDKNISLVLVGASTEYLQNLKSLSRMLEIDRRILFFADIPNNYIGMFYQHASVFVLNSRREGFGLVILEAGLYQKPVIATITGGIAEIIQDNENGLLLPVMDNPELLQDKLRFLLNHPQDAEKYGKKLYQRVITEFSWGKKYQEYLKLFLPGQ